MFFKSTTFFCLSLIICSYACNNPDNSSKQYSITNGKQLFNLNCSGCHNISGGQKFGPNLIGVTNKREHDWLIQFIQSSHELIKNGDEEAKLLYDDFGHKTMPDYPHLSIEQINAILDYIRKNSPTLNEIMDTLPFPDEY